MDWYDVAPPNWPIARSKPYVFGQACAALAIAAPAGFRVVGTGALEAQLSGPERVAEVRHVLSRAVWQALRHQRTIERMGRLIVEITLGMDKGQ